MYQPYVANHKKWDHVGNLTPNIEISEGIRPSEELKPASYLKLVRFDKYLEDYYVVSAGKVVALDSNGDVVPAGLALQAAAYSGAYAGGDLGTCIAAGRAAPGSRRRRLYSRRRFLGRCVQVSARPSALPPLRLFCF